MILIQRKPIQNDIQFEKNTKLLLVFIQVKLKIDIRKAILNRNRLFVNIPENIQYQVSKELIKSNYTFLSHFHFIQNIAIFEFK